MDNVTRTSKPAVPIRLRTLIQLIFSKLILWHRNYRTRRHLSELPEHLWDDIGLEKQRVLKEVRKPFWR